MKSFNDESTVAGRLRLALKKAGKSSYTLEQDLGISSSTLTRILSGETKNPRIQTLEQICNYLSVELAWILHGGTQKSDNKSSQLELSAITEQVAEDQIVLKKWDAHFGQGTGVPAEMHCDEIIGQLNVSQEWARKHLPQATKYENIALVTGLGDSMEPTYYDGETLFIDLGYTEFKLDTVYAFMLYGDLYIKRIQRRKGVYYAKSDNPKYDDWEITPEDMPHLTVYGRIIKGVRVFNT